MTIMTDSDRVTPIINNLPTETQKVGCQECLHQWNADVPLRGEAFNTRNMLCPNCGYAGIAIVVHDYDMDFLERQYQGWLDGVVDDGLMNHLMDALRIAHWRLTHGR